jgi:soluble lytic murein transglycosylase-like protein
MLRLRTVLPCALLIALLWAPCAEAATYTVRFGDTLTGIAARYHTSLQHLARINHIQPYGVLQAGARLRVPGTATAAPKKQAPAPAATHRRAHHRWRGHYTVRWGDTLTAIAAAHHTTLAKLARVNAMAPYGLLVTGRRLRVPRGGHARPAARPARHHARPHHRHHARHHRHHHASPAARTVRQSIDYWSARYRVDRHLTRALAWMESGWQPGVVSSVGAWGVMQVTPATWNYVQLVLIRHHVPRTTNGNIHVGVAYLHHLLQSFGGNRTLALAAYYQGPGAVALFGVLPVSRPYIANVLALSHRM